MRNATFAKTKTLMYLLDRHYSGLFSNSESSPTQENGDDDLSFVSEALRQIEHSDNPNQDVELLKDVAAMAYVGESALCILCFPLV